MSAIHAIGAALLGSSLVAFGGVTKAVGGRARKGTGGHLLRVQRGDDSLYVVLSPDVP